MVDPVPIRPPDPGSDDVLARMQLLEQKVDILQQSGSAGGDMNTRDPEVADMPPEQTSQQISSWRNLVPQLATIVGVLGSAIGIAYMFYSITNSRMDRQEARINGAFKEMREDFKTELADERQLFKEQMVLDRNLYRDQFDRQFNQVLENQKDILRKLNE